MVKIRYAELPAGLHVATEDRDGCTIVYLLPGLTPRQRQAALTFARRGARIGHGPSLPAIDMAFAVAADRARTTGRTITAVLRRHPMLLLPLVAVVSAVIVASTLSFVTVNMAPFPATDPASHATSGPLSKVTDHPSPRSSPAHVTHTGRKATPNSVSTPTSGVRPALLPTMRAAVSDTPSVAGESTLPATGRSCITIGRMRICVRS
jgi:hypothetical protein